LEGFENMKLYNKIKELFWGGIACFNAGGTNHSFRLLRVHDHSILNERAFLYLKGKGDKK